ncbi:MAG: AI-2E family transporter, partial [Vicingaceae bacterium]
RYIIGLLIVISIIAVLNTVGLLALGIKYAVFMGILSAALTVIPYIGIFIGALLPVVVALITKDSLFYPLAVIAIFGFVQFLEGNFITPNIIGSKVNVNPMAAIVALIIGAKIWGIAGMILAIPICGILKIMFSHYPRLKPYAILLQSTNKDDEEKSMEVLKEKLRKRKESARKKKENKSET